MGYSIINQPILKAFSYKTVKLSPHATNMPTRAALNLNSRAAIHL